MREVLEMAGRGSVVTTPSVRTPGGCHGAWRSRAACCMHRGVLFLDEPRVGLAPQTRASIWEHINDKTQRVWC